MSEISNKTLVGLLVVAIVISLAGTFISLNKLGQLTGLAQANVTTQSGTTSVTVLGTAQLTLYNSTIAWGSGQINGTYTVGHDFCNLTTNGTINSGGNDFTASSLGTGGQSAACDPFTTSTPWSFVVENTGNTDFTTVNMTSLGGNTSFVKNFTSSVTNGSWTYRFDEEGTGACTEAYSGAYNTFPSTTPATVCSAFSATSDDAFEIQVRLSLPEDAAAQAWSDTVTFTGNV